MPAKQWKPVRLTIDTLMMLDDVKATLERAHESGKRTLTHGPKGEITNDETIRILAEHFLAHKRRSNRKRVSV